MGSASGLKSLLIGRGAEYIDVIAHGLDSHFLISSGFKEVDGDVIIPNYFEPFVQSNVLTLYAHEPIQKDTIRIFKADGDQDRASVLLGKPNL